MIHLSYRLTPPKPLILNQASMRIHQHFYLSFTYAKNSLYKHPSNTCQVFAYTCSGVVFGGVVALASTALLRLPRSERLFSANLRLALWSPLLFSSSLHSDP